MAPRTAPIILYWVVALSFYKHRHYKISPLSHIAYPNMISKINYSDYCIMSILSQTWYCWYGPNINTPVTCYCCVLYNAPNINTPVTCYCCIHYISLALNINYLLQYQLLLSGVISLYLPPLPLFTEARNSFQVCFNFTPQKTQDHCHVLLSPQRVGALLKNSNMHFTIFTLLTWRRNII